MTTKAAYNAIGQRTSVNDPNQGAWSFAYNGLGEVLNQTDARGIVTAMTYDKLSRPLSRSATIDVTGDNVADTVADSWSYDPANAKGAPLSESRSINGVSERTTTQTYDSLARPVQSDIVQRLTSGTGNYRLRTKYDSYYGRPVGQEYPNGEAVQALYGNYGHALAEKDPITGTEYRRTNSVNARGQATQETFGNGVVLNPQYQWQTGQLTELKYSKNGSDLRKLGYGYDVFGNLKQQTLNTNQSQEDYSYDELHRLVQSIRSGAASGTVHYGFDAVGNFTKKTDFSTSAANAYSYTGGACGGGANAVKSIALAAGGTRTYCYDANGNLTGDNAGLSLKYDHMGMTTVAQRGALRDDFRYGADGGRTRSWGSDGSRIYLPGYEHRIDTNETKVYVGDYAVITNGSAGRKVEYLLKDRLGSVDAVANNSGTITETRGYDAFGKPRSGTWADLAPPKLGSTNVTPKGFTQHEHLNQLELIHMNGRVFDYNVGRFTGVDPVIQFPLNSQSLNPYSYILNNPLSGTDPTGYETECPEGMDSCSVTAEAPSGSHIKSNTVVSGSKDGVTVTQTYDRRGNMTNQSITGTFNGASKGTSTTGTEGRKDKSAAINKKGSSESNEIGGHEFAFGANGEGDRPPPPRVVASCSGYAPSQPAMCYAAKGITSAARTGISASEGIVPDYKNPDVIDQTRSENGAVHWSLPYHGDIDDRLFKYVENDWTDGDLVLETIRNPDGVGVNMTMISTRKYAEKFNYCNCLDAWSVGGRTSKDGRTVWINEDRSLQEQKMSLSHEVGHVAFGGGHPSKENPFMSRGIMDYKYRRVTPEDRMLFNKNTQNNY